ncbi:MAG TPA: DUF1398 family protein [Candidatus Babeliales bacterium]|nr:DUF1398 family protein [Candidatus Babeliales bacterium]
MEQNTISQINNIAMVLKQAEKEGWPYPVQFEALRNAGVTSYEVSPSTYDKTFYGPFGVWHINCNEDNLPLTTVTKKFNEELFMKALLQRRFKETTYIVFLQNIALAGIARYHVDMNKRTVTYFDTDDNAAYVQDIPQAPSHP